MAKPFEPGDDARRGRGPEKGAPNAGRPTKLFSTTCREAADREDLVGKLLDIASGRVGDIVILKTGVEVQVSRPADRISAAKVILAYAHGQPVQPVDNTATVPHEDALAALG